VDQLRARLLLFAVPSLASRPRNLAANRPRRLPRMSEDQKPTPDADAKAKFREALERKKQANANRPSTPGSTGAVHEAHGKAGGKREFRRKSG